MIRRSECVSVEDSRWDVHREDVQSRRNLRRILWSFVFAWRLGRLVAVIERWLRVGFRPESTMADRRKRHSVMRNQERQSCVLQRALMTTAVKISITASSWWHFRGYGYVLQELSESWIAFHIKRGEVTLRKEEHEPSGAFSFTICFVWLEKPMAWPFFFTFLFIFFIFFFIQTKFLT